MQHLSAHAARLLCVMNVFVIVKNCIVSDWCEWKWDNRKSFLQNCSSI